MSAKQGYPRALFWFLAVHTLLLFLWGLICLGDLVLHPFVTDPWLNSRFARLIAGLFIAPASFVIGGLILRRENHNLVGLLMFHLGSAILASTIRDGISDPTALYIQRSLAVGGYLTPIILLIFYFPNGRSFPPRHARFIDIFLLLLLVPWTFGTFFGDPISNPFYLPIANAIFEFMRSIWVINLTVLLILMPYSVYMRYRHGGRQQRLQMKWFVATIFMFLCVLLLMLLIRSIAPDFIVPEAGNTLFYLALFAFPMFAIGNAILRHRLYDIDIIIRRTLVYSVLTGILAAIYFGGIILTQQLFRAATGETSDLAIVVSTLLIAALFSPVRRRVQEGIDRRLYRRKYDAEKTLADFQKNLRDEVEVETLKANLVGVVSDTMQPARMALWVREIKGE